MTETTIITPTVGTPELLQACSSVASQVEPALHLLVVDGPDHAAAVAATVSRVVNEYGDGYRCATLVLPWNTGKGGVNGHRAYGAGACIVTTPYFSFLDEDNFLAPDWTQTMRRALLDNPAARYATCRRTIVDPAGGTIGKDDVESIGDNRLGYRLYDTSTFMFRLGMAMYIPRMAVRYYRDLPDKTFGDRDLTEALWKVPHVHLRGYHGTCYRSPRRLCDFFRSICGATPETGDIGR